MPTFTHPRSTPNCTPPNSDCPHPREVSQLRTTPASQFLDQNLEPGHTSPATATQSENLCCPVFTRIQIQTPLPTATTLASATEVLLTAVDSRRPCFPQCVLSAQWLRQLLQSGCQIVSLLCCEPAYPRPNPCTYTTLPSTACFLSDGTVTVPPPWAAVALGCCSRPGLLLSALCLDIVRFAPSNYIRGGFPDPLFSPV